MTPENKYDLFKKLEQQAPGYKTELPGNAWSRIESRLENKQQGKKISFYKSIYGAAIVLLLVASVSIIAVYMKASQKDLFSDNNVYSIYTIEELEVDEYTYPVYDVHSLLASYQLLFEKGSSIYLKDIEEIRAELIN